MNSIVTGSTPVPASAESGTELAVPEARQWSTEQDGPNDKVVDIWYNGSWVPAFFKDIRKGDFYLILDVHLNPTQCFLAASNCQRSTPMRRWSSKEEAPTFFIRNGSEIVQAPAIHERYLPVSNASHPLLKEK
jgi:hypothetical protein